MCLSFLEFYYFTNFIYLFRLSDLLVSYYILCLSAYFYCYDYSFILVSFARSY